MRRHNARSRASEVLVIALSTIAVVLATASAASASGAAFSITPVGHVPYFIYSAAPGSVVTGRVRVANVTATAGQVSLYAVDATTGQTSGAVYLARTAPRRGVGAWVTLSTPGLTLGPHQHTVVSFSVQIPASTGSGQHLGGLVAAPTQPRSVRFARRGKTAFHVKIQEISIVAVEVNTPGARQQLMHITSLSASGRPGYQTLVIGLGDVGNTLLKGRGKLVVWNARGKRVLDDSFALDTFVPHTRIAFPVYVQGKRLLVGRYRGRVTVFYGAGHEVTRTFGFMVTSKRLRETFGTTVPKGFDGGVGIGNPSPSTPTWELVLGGLAILALGIGGSAYFFRPRRARTIVVRDQRSEVPDEARSDDDRDPAAVD